MRFRLVGAIAAGGLLVLTALALGATILGGGHHRVGGSLRRTALFAPAAWASGQESEWRYSLPVRQLDSGIKGASNARLLRFLAKLHANKPVHVALLGGSFSMPSGHVWLQQVVDGLYAQFPGATISSHNAAYGGTNPAFSLLCLAEQLTPRPIDLVLLDYNNNNGHEPAPVLDQRIRSFERLIRRLLEWPGQPAVLAHHFLPPDQVYKDFGYYAAAEDGVALLLEYYQQLSLSMRASMFHEQRQGKPGYTGADIRTDGLHFNELGHKYAADYVMRALEIAGSYLPSTNLSDLAGAIATLPEPMLPGNYPKQTKLCAIKDSVQSLALTNSGFEFGAEDQRKGKTGFIAHQPGAYITFALNTTIPGVADQQHALLYVAYLRSYEHMGTAEVSCESGCTCAPMQLQGHWEHKLSLTVLDKMNVTQHDNCIVKLLVQEPTLSGEHKVKLFGLVITELSSQPDEAQWWFGHEVTR